MPDTVDGERISMEVNRYRLLAQAERRIYRAWYAALIASSMSLIITAFTAGAMDAFGREERLAAGDAFLVLALAYGVLKRSRVAATLLLIHLLLLQGTGLVLSPNPGFLAVPVVLLFAYLYADGLRGTIEHHRLTRNAGEPPDADFACLRSRRRRRLGAVLRR